MLSRAWPSPTRRSSASHVRCPSGPRWSSRSVARSRASAGIGPRAEYIATIPHMPYPLSRPGSRCRGNPNSSNGEALNSPPGGNLGPSQTASPIEGGGNAAGPVTGLPHRRPLLMRNDKEVAIRFLGVICGRLGECCGHPELPRRDAEDLAGVQARRFSLRVLSRPRVKHLQSYRTVGPVASLRSVTWPSCERHLSLGLVSGRK